MRKTYLITVLLCLLSIASFAQAGDVGSSDWKDRIYFGGNLGFQFGTITNVEVSPIVGYRINERLSAGLGVTYIYYKIDFDNRPDFETNIYGGRLFGRYRITDQIFAQAEYESLNLEFFDINDGRVKREWVPGLFVGGGFFQPIGKNAGFSIMALYNLIFDEQRSPYNDPLVLRIGFSVGF